MSTSSHRLPKRGIDSRTVWHVSLGLGSSALLGYLLAVVTTPLPRHGQGPAYRLAHAAEKRATQLSVSSLRTAEAAYAKTSDAVSRYEYNDEQPANYEVTSTPAVPEPDPNLSSAPPALVSDATSSCPQGMLLVEGEYCPSVAHRCLNYLSVERDRCAEYAEGNRCFGNPSPLRFCIDQFEYPNIRGTKPEVAVSYREAEAKCAETGKRLCTAKEWTLACEGPERLPYPTGRMRDENACNYDKPYRLPDNDAYANPRTRALEVKRLDQSVASGELNECVSAYGVHDMTGNVDEWVYNEEGQTDARPYQSGLKGGYWGPVRNRCRPMTLDHNEWHSGYQIGFRCCADGQDQSSATEAVTPPEAPRAAVNEGEVAINEGPVSG